VDLGRLPPPDDGAHLVDAMDAALNKAQIGHRVVVLGGGKVGLTLAQSLARDGHRVVIAEPEKRIGGDCSPTWKWRHKQWVDELKIETLTGTRATAIAKEGVQVRNETGETRRIEADTVIAAGPMVPNQDLWNDFQWMVDELHGAGDANVARDLTQAIHEGYRLGCRI
jgi:2,4-dienoyl-CoA reductase (NADPH2)